MQNNVVKLFITNLKTWVDYKRTIGQKNYAEKLKSAVVNFNLNKQ